MALFRRWFLIGSVLVLGGGPLLAAGGREERALAPAIAAFQDGNWSRAEMQLTNFVKRFASSTNVPSAALLAAQAKFKQGKYADAAAWLKARAAGAGGLVPDYTYWLAEAQFATGDFTNAAETFLALTKNFPASPLCLTAVVEAAAAYAQFPDWPRHDALLEATNGIFARAAQSDPDNAVVVNGRLSLAQSKLAQADYAAAGKLLGLLNPDQLAPEQDWERLSLLYQVRLGVNDLDAALTVTTNLMASAKDAGHLADSVALRATVLEKKSLPVAAVAAWSENLTASAPVERQREAILKIAALAAAQSDYTNAAVNLETYLTKFTNAPEAELALLTLGELHMKEFLATSVPDQLTAAQTNFDQFISAFTKSPLSGKACLDQGWCNWQAGDYTNSLVDFRAAAQRLTNSPVDQAVAKFKTGDALFVLGQYDAARSDYAAVLTGYAAFPGVAKSLGDRALYQILRADLKLGELVDAEATMKQLLRDFPASDLSDNGQLLLGEAFSDFGQPEKAREVFQEFARQFPGSPLTPQVELAVARTYERGQDWPAAITNYEAWLIQHPTNDQLPQVQYALGRANYQAGRETNAFQIFSALVARFPADTNAPLAQWWVADHFFRLGGTNFATAELNYELLFQTPAWKNSDLFFSAQLMAGRAAEGRLGFSDAANYLTRLVNDTNCPAALKTQAMFAYGGVLMRMDSPDTNRPFLNFENATNEFSLIIQANPTNAFGALAGSKLGDCYLQLGALDAATNAYAQVVNASAAGVGLRNCAQVGWGRVLEKKAEAAPPEERKALQLQALDLYWDVVYDPTADAFWAKKAGLQALPLMTVTGAGDVDKFFGRLEVLLPQLKDSLEKKKSALGAVKN